ncbi:Unknown protein [Striga hermonthica]|uniref:Uncharacterized protein n=1 Tax=Striga hermonthica TaxID=68872 RepID=A0A9N7NLN3_STRHE|nr:Unknown protein [Striga hermonthica]
MTASFLVRRFRPISSSRGRWAGTLTPRKQSNDDASEARVEKEKVEPITTFSRPPPFSPFLGSLVALSMLQSWSKRDNNDD